MIVGVICLKCVEAACAEYPCGVDTRQGRLDAFAVCLDPSKEVHSHVCSELIQDPMGGFWGCSCVHEHSA